MARKYKQLNNATMTPGSAFDTEHNNLAWDQLLLNYSATITGTAAAITEDAAYRMMGVPEVSQAEEPIIRLEGRTLRHLSAFLSGGYCKTLQPTTGGIFAGAVLDLGKILPGTYVSGEVKTFIRGNVEGFLSYGTTLTALAGTLRPSVATVDRPAGLRHTRPLYREFTIGIPANESAQTHLMTVDQDMVSAGLFLVVRDASAGNGGGTRVDTLVRAITLDITRGKRGQEQHVRQTWGQLRENTARAAGFTDLDWDEATGTVFIPFVDDTDPRWSGRMAFSEGDTILLTIDSSATIEEHLGTALTAAAGDNMRVVRLDHQVIPGTGAAPVTAPPSARQAIALAPGVATTRRTGRRRRRRAVR